MGLTGALSGSSQQHLVSSGGQGEGRLQRAPVFAAKSTSPVLAELRYSQLQGPLR